LDFVISNFYQEGATGLPPLALASGNVWTFEEDSSEGLHLAWIEVDLSSNHAGVSVELAVRGLNRYTIGLWLRCLGPTGGMWSQDIDLWGFQARDRGVEENANLGWCEVSRAESGVCKIHWSIADMPAGQRVRLYFVAKPACGQASSCLGTGKAAFEVTEVRFGPAKSSPSQLLHPTHIRDAHIATCRDYYDLILKRFPPVAAFTWLEQLRFDLDEYASGYVRSRLGDGVTSCSSIVAPRRNALFKGLSESWGPADLSGQNQPSVAPDHTMVAICTCEEIVLAIKHLRNTQTKRLVAVLPVSFIVDFGFEALKQLSRAENQWLTSGEIGAEQGVQFSAAWTLHSLCLAAGIELDRTWLSPFLAQRINLGDGIMTNGEPVVPAPDWQEGRFSPTRQTILCCDLIFGDANA
jgi:hypothetical protein